MPDDFPDELSDALPDDLEDGLSGNVPAGPPGSVPVPSLAGPLAGLRRRYAGATWTAVTIGMSGADVHRLDDRRGSRYLKIARRTARPDPGLDPVAEAERMRWLAGQGVPVPEVLDQGGDAEYSWLLTRAVPGRSAAEPWPAGRRGAVVDAVADAALALHALPAARCPFDQGLAVTLERARRAAEDALVDTGRLEAFRAGRADGVLAELAAAAPAVEDTVVCHGDYCLPNVLLDPGTLRVTGLVDLGRAGRADRYADLALMTRSLASGLNPQYGPAYARRFLARYLGAGMAADEDRLDFYRRLEDVF
jgi:kanamycin kinase/aminoglycoside 3'-phosphotransferase-2